MIILEIGFWFCVAASVLALTNRLSEIGLDALCDHWSAEADERSARRRRI